MRKITFLLSFFCFVTIGHAEIKLILHADDKAFIQALIMVESNDKDKVVGDSGNAYGCLQIHEKTVKDINRLQSLEFSHNDMFNRIYAIYACYIYLMYWGDNYFVETGRKPSYETLARIWNGGPEGYKSEKTNYYWQKVKGNLSNKESMITLMNKRLKSLKQAKVEIE